MIEFRALKNSKKSGARIGILKTPHGEVETPALVPVATQGVVKTLTSEEARAAKCQILIANTFHLHLKPGEKIIKSSGGLHKFMNWQWPLMTDSGGFQVFSLGFGHDLGVGKVLGFFPGEKGKGKIIDKNDQPKEVRITSQGVYFRSPINGEKLFVGPEESIKIQEQLGADIIFAFDECTPPFSTYDYVKKAVRRTHDWAKICVDSKKSNQALFGIVQGSKYKDLREESARYINSLGFDGFGIGGDLGESKKDMTKILSWIIPHFDEKKPRHMLGIGQLEDMEGIVKSGIDLFDCTVPTHYGRRGIAFVNSGLPAVALAKAGRLDLNKSIFLKDKKPLDSKCNCFVCQNYKRNYISHLLKASEITAMRLLTFHNLYFFNTFVEKIRIKIKNNQI
ncbi:MAG: tRNA guanosine(34) transglycosylase Tgt [Candidatus Azambacteria bacterium]|nr:tRNA guanosine(34) transglycosylase Tgt [Candidatus Azambacteria bacterium]